MTSRHRRVRAADRIVLVALLALLLRPLPLAAAVHVPATSTGSYTVTWDEPSGGQVRAYLYERFNGGSASSTTVTGANSRTFTSRPPGTYGYRLRICMWEPELGQEICEPYSAEATVVVSTVPVPGTPGPLTVTPAQSTGTFSIAWGTVTGTVTYTLEEQVSPTATWTAVNTSATSPTSRTRPDGSYSYRVRACAGATCGGYSNVASVTVLGTPGVPGSLGPNLTTGTAYTLSWGASTGTVTKYVLQERVGTAAWKNVHSSTTRSKTFSDKDEAVYEYRVQACNASFCSGFTASKFVTVAPPPNLTGPTTSSGVFTLSWTLPPSPGDVPRLEERVGTGTWRTVFDVRGHSASTIYKVCQSCSAVTYQYRLRMCDFEPELPQPICDQPGAVHRVAVTHTVDDVRASVPACTVDQRNAWTRARDSQGVAGTDGGAGIGLDPEFKELPPAISFPNWYPVDGYKHTLCGRVHHFEVYDGFYQEMDFNHFIRPDADHSYILDDVFTESAHDCAPGSNNCVETEVTPDQALYDNPYFNRDWTSALTGRDACVFGPWVTEFSHGDRPEIHPSEQIWWRSEEDVLGVPTDVRRMAVVQDRSERFSRWAYAPRQAIFSVPFEVGPIDATQVFTVAQEAPFVRNVVTAADPSAVWDADDGTTHGLVVATRRIVEANEQQPFDDDLGVRFVDVCQESGGRIRGMLRIRTHVGGDMTTNTGFSLLKVSTPAVAGALTAPLETLARAGVAEEREAAVPVAVRRSVVDGRPALTMDMEVSARGLSAAALRVEDRRLSVAVGGAGPRGGELVRDVPVPLRDGAVLEWQSESGAVREAPLTAIALDPRVGEVRPTFDRGTDVAAATWAAVAKAAGRQAAGSPPPPALVAVTRWDLRLDTEYGARRRGRVTEDDQSIVLEELNEALEQRGASALALFGTEAPVATEWSFEARDLATGASVPVAVGRAADAHEIAVEVASSRLPHDSLRVRFPSLRAGAVYEVAATAHTRDSLGVTGERQHRFWSVAIADESREGLAASVFQGLAGEASRSPEALRALAAEAPGVTGTADETVRRRARVLEQRTRQYALDGWITVDELEVLGRMARRLAE